MRRLFPVITWLLHARYGMRRDPRLEALFYELRPAHVQLDAFDRAFLLCLEGAQEECHDWLRVAEQSYSWTAYRWLGQTLVLASCGHPAEALQSAELLEATLPGRAEVHYLLGWLSRQLGDSSRARREFQQALAYSPDHQEALAELLLLV